MDGRQHDGWCRWDRHDREAVADARAASYSARRTGAVIALQVRLGKTGERQLPRGFRRMLAYAAAYRDEWGHDVIENGHRHQLYLDRVTEYWSQRQRVGDVKKLVA